MSTKVEEYTTTDFYTAAALIMSKFKVREVSASARDSKVKVFHFENSEELHRVRMEYLNGSLEGNVKEFKNAIETVKDLIHSS